MREEKRSPDDDPGGICNPVLTSRSGGTEAPSGSGGKPTGGVEGSGMRTDSKGFPEGAKGETTEPNGRPVPTETGALDGTKVSTKRQWR